MPEQKPFDPSTVFAKFVSSVEGHLCARYGSNPRVNIGAERVFPDPNKPPSFYDFDAPRVTLKWDTAAISAITHREYAQFQREYDKAIATGALKERTAAEYLAWVAAQNTPAATAPTTTQPTTTQNAPAKA